MLLGVNGSGAVQSLTRCVSCHGSPPLDCLCSMPIC
jgi:hypothetical protein